MKKRLRKKLARKNVEVTRITHLRNEFYHLTPSLHV